MRYVSGSVEAACGLGLADAVVDLVETGTTMKAAGLEVVAEVMQSEAILISNPQSERRDVIELIKKRIEGYITATKFMMISYNVAEKDLEGESRMLEGKKMGGRRVWRGKEREQRWERERQSEHYTKRTRRRMILTR